jgi:hypothetical protein
MRRGQGGDAPHRVERLELVEQDVRVQGPQPLHVGALRELAHQSLHARAFRAAAAGVGMASVWDHDTSVNEGGGKSTRWLSLALIQALGTQGLLRGCRGSGTGLEASGTRKSLPTALV